MSMWINKCYFANKEVMMYNEQYILKVSTNLKENVAFKAIIFFHIRKKYPKIGLTECFNFYLMKLQNVNNKLRLQN